MGLVSWGEADRRSWISSLTSHSAFSSLLCQICGSLQVLWILPSDTSVWATKSYPGFGVLILFPWILPIGFLFPIPVEWILMTGLDGAVTATSLNQTLINCFIRREKCYLRQVEVPDLETLVPFLYPPLYLSWTCLFYPTLNISSKNPLCIMPSPVFPYFWLELLDISCCQLIVLINIKTNGTISWDRSFLRRQMEGPSTTQPRAAPEIQNRVVLLVLHSQAWRQILIRTPSYQKKKKKKKFHWMNCAFL